MIKIERTLLKEQYAGMEYTGENVLHIAIIKKRADIVKKLVAMEPKLLEARATGNFFTVGHAYTLITIYLIYFIRFT